MIKLAKIFQDGMTFQRNKPCKVWGTSSEEKTVTIYMNERKSPKENCRKEILLFFFLRRSSTECNCPDRK